MTNTPAPLPEAVRQLAARLGCKNGEALSHVRLHQTGQMRHGGASPWMDFTARQRIELATYAFEWNARTGPWGVVRVNNIRAGARTPVAGILHSLFLLVFMLVAAPLAGYIPLPALAGVLLVVAWSMAEKEEFIRQLRSWPTALIVLATFSLTLAEDLTVGIIAGCVVAGFLAWLRRPAPAEDA